MTLAGRDVLGVRALNRALLARQMLLRRAKLPAARALEHLVGLQAQIPNAPYIGLWTRLDGFDPGELSRMITARRAVRGTLLRATLHVVTARDYLALRPLLQPVMERCLNGGFGRHLAGLDTGVIVSAGRALLEKQPRGGAELGTRLHERWADRDARALGYAVQYLAPLVQTPPRGVWGANGPPTWATAEDWLGRPLKPGLSADKLVLRYLAAFGPATVADMRVWSGLPGLREVAERLRRRLRTFRDERGEELFDLPGAPRPDPETPAPPRFLPCYDNVALAHADRSRIVGDGARLFTSDGLLRGTVLVDGFIGGRWQIVRERKAAVLTVEPFARLRRADRAALDDEGRRLCAFVARILLIDSPARPHLDCEVRLLPAP